MVRCTWRGAAFALVVTTQSAACGKEEPRRAPANAGQADQVCARGLATIAAPAPRYRGSWTTNLKDAHANTRLASLRVEWILADINGKPSGELACVHVDKVHPMLSISPDISAVTFVGDPRPYLMLRVWAELKGPARVKNGTLLNHPEASLSWTIKARAESVEVEREPTGAVPDFSPDWDNVKLETEEPKVSIEALNAGTNP